MLKIIRIALWAILMTVTGLLALSASGILGDDNSKTVVSKSVLGGPFTLTSTKGEAFTDQDLLGNNIAIFFGFTNCPDVCPTTLFELSNASRELSGRQKDNLKFVFVSVDHERDTPEFLADYLGASNSQSLPHFLSKNRRR